MYYLQYLKVTKNSTDLSKPFTKNVPKSENKREKTFEIELIERSGLNSLDSSIYVFPIFNLSIFGKIELLTFSFYDSLISYSN